MPPEIPTATTNPGNQLLELEHPAEILRRMIRERTRSNLQELTDNIAKGQLPSREVDPERIVHTFVYPRQRAPIIPEGERAYKWGMNLRGPAAPELCLKPEFTRVVKELGYSAPPEVVLELPMLIQGDSKDELEALATLFQKHFPDWKGEYVTKTPYLSRGKGMEVHRNTDELLAFIRDILINYKIKSLRQKGGLSSIDRTAFRVWLLREKKMNADRVDPIIASLGSLALIDNMSVSDSLVYMFAADAPSVIRLLWYVFHTTPRRGTFKEYRENLKSNLAAITRETGMLAGEYALKTMHPEELAAYKKSLLESMKYNPYGGSEHAEIIVQEKLPTEFTCRYVYCRNSAEKGEYKGFRMVYENRPLQIIGDGKHTVSDLIENAVKGSYHNDPKRLEEIMVNAVDAKQLTKVSEPGKLYYEHFASNQAKGSINPLTEIAQRNLDKLIGPFIGDMEAHVRRTSGDANFSMNVAVFDLLCTNNKTLHNPEATLEELKKCVFFVEMQDCPDLLFEDYMLDQYKEATFTSTDRGGATIQRNWLAEGSRQLVGETLNQIRMRVAQQYPEVDILGSLFTISPGALKRPRGPLRKALRTAQITVELEAKKPTKVRDYGNVLQEIRRTLRQAQDEKGQPCLTAEEIEGLISEEQAFGSNVVRVAAEERLVLEELRISAAAELVRVDPEVIYKFRDMEVIANIASKLNVKVSPFATDREMQREVAKLKGKK